MKNDWKWIDHPYPTLNHFSQSLNFHSKLTNITLYFSSYTQLFLSFHCNYFISHLVINNLTLKIMNLELDLYPIISNKIIRQKDWKSIKEHKPGFWSRKDIEGNRLVRTQRGYFLNNKNISVTSAQSFILSHGIQDVPQNIF